MFQPTGCFLLAWVVLLATACDQADRDALGAAASDAATIVDGTPLTDASVDAPMLARDLAGRGDQGRADLAALSDLAPPRDLSWRADLRADQGGQNDCRQTGCSPGSYCELSSGSCRAGCLQDSACPSGQICENRSCRVGCRSDSTCATAQICENLGCRAGCRQTSDCQAHQRCDPAVLSGLALSVGRRWLSALASRGAIADLSDVARHAACQLPGGAEVVRHRTELRPTPAVDQRRDRSHGRRGRDADGQWTGSDLVRAELLHDGTIRSIAAGWAALAAVLSV